MENFGVVIALALPPHAYTFGVFPLHWKYVKHATVTTCADCGAESRAIHLRIGPLLFAVTRAHEHPE